MRYEGFYMPQEIELMVKALKAIEMIARDQCPKEKHHGSGAWCDVFRLAHAGRSPSCRNAHLEWEKRIEQTEEEI